METTISVISTSCQEMKNATMAQGQNRNRCRRKCK
ncbi:hypothetical protein SPAB_05198 [Salmonella enterica subsp. enterica serovar Paratyphi B str. SPB7]|uniref:Uncharacterized protein n=1 Tax=Salmonella paratyphi B (strain ATCC BAA-1250 / SPB7) TaxID=1016998 RepID=A0A6C6Z9P9_SALPB|nr:hypothetical protein SPAB_05198 [Salmonella enterica subsp. enterica serovar Paratyphi B str. SPB7]